MIEENQVLVDKKVTKVPQVRPVLMDSQVFQEHRVHQVSQVLLEKKVLVECQDQVDNQAYQAFQD